MSNSKKLLNNEIFRENEENYQQKNCCFFVFFELGIQQGIFCDIPSFPVRIFKTSFDRGSFFRKLSYISTILKLS